MKNFEANDAIKWMQHIEKKMTQNKHKLTELDEVIGDGDHGYNMAIGFQSVTKLLTEEVSDYPADILRKSAQAILTNVTGASGILYATAFMNMSESMNRVEKVDVTLFTKALHRAISEMKRRGNVKIGDKTLIDVWVKVYKHFKDQATFPRSSLIEVAKQAMLQTKGMQARSGRAALLEEKSKGHIDPGAASSYYIFLALAETIEEL